MDDKKLFKLVAAAVVMVVLALLVSMPADSGSDKVAANTPLIQGMGTDNIAAIEVSGGGKKARLVKTDSGFVVESRENYPALFSEVNGLIVNCLDIKVSEYITSNPDNYAELQVMESNADKLIKFFDAEGKLITGVVIGKRDQSTGRTFVRKLSADEKAESKVYLADRVSWIYTNPVSYVEKRILECTRDNISSVEVTTPEGAYTIVAKKEADKVKPELINIPEGKEVKGTDFEGVFDAATDISFDDMQKVKSVQQDLKYNYKYVIKSNDQTILTLKIAKGQADGTEKFFMTCSSVYDNKEFMAKVKAGNLSISKDKKAMEDADQQLQTYQSVEDFNARHKDWVYTMEPYKANKLVKSLSTLIQDIPAPAAEDNSQPEAVPAN